MDTWIQTEINGGGKFNCPIGIVADTEGNLYVADSINSRVQKINRNGEFLQFIGPPVWGEQGVVNREVHYPIGLDLDNNDNIYVADTAVGEVKVFDKTGNFICSWRVNEGAVQPEIVDIACGNDCVYITDKANNRVLKYTLEGEYISEWASSTVGAFNYPSGIDVNESLVYINEVFNERIQVFDSNDQLV
jgi:DNA-binding beta-propeller fold protein YncE